MYTSILYTNIQVYTEYIQNIQVFLGSIPVYADP